MADYSYDNIGTLLGDIVDEAIASQMYLIGFHGSTSEGFTGSFGPGDPLRISPLGGKYEGSTFSPGGQVTDMLTGQKATFLIPPHYGLPFEDLAGMSSYFDNRVNEIFQPWWDTPQPSAFDGQLDQADKAAHLFAYQGDTKSGPGVDYFQANDALRSIQTIQDGVGNLHGAAMLTFKNDFSNVIDDIVNAQDGAAIYAWACLRGEQEIWVRAQQGMADAAGKAAEAMKAIRDGGDPAVVFRVLGALASLASIPATGGLAAALSVAGVTSGFTATLFPPKGADTSVPLQADTPFGVLDNWSKALDQLKQDIRKEEDAQRSKIDQMTGYVNGKGFDLSTPAIVNEDDRGQLYDTEASVESVKAEYDDMRSIANTMMRDLADTLRTAGSMAVDSGSGPWTRPGDIGLGATGYHSSWAALNTAIRDAATRTALSIDEAADVMIVLVDDLGKTDDAVKADMDRLQTNVQQQEAAYH